MAPGQAKTVIVCPDRSRLMVAAPIRDAGWGLESVDVPGAAPGPLVAGARLPGGDLAVLTDTLRLLRVARSLELSAERNLATDGWGALPHSVVIIPDGLTISVGIGEEPPRSALGIFDIASVDAETWTVRARGSLPTTLWSISASPGARTGRSGPECWPRPADRPRTRTPWARGSRSAMGRRSRSSSHRLPVWAEPDSGSPQDRRDGRRVPGPVPGGMRARDLPIQIPLDAHVMLPPSLAVQGRAERALRPVCTRGPS